MAKKRRKIQENEKLVLFGHTKGYCPLCGVELVYKKGSSRRKRFEIAHIYPLNPTQQEKELLEGEEILNEDFDHHDNLICLCVVCHTKYDDEKTIEEYRELVEKRKQIDRARDSKAIWTESKLEKEIVEILELLSSVDLSNGISPTYDPKKIDEKSESSLTQLTKRKIKQNVQDYFFIINSRMKEIEKASTTRSEIISAGIKLHYKKLSEKIDDQKELYYEMVKWINGTTGKEYDEAGEIVVSYFIQNCEVF